MQVEVFDPSGRAVALVVSIGKLELAREPLGVIRGIGIGYDGSIVRWQFTPLELSVLLGDAIALDPSDLRGATSIEKETT